jgi:hypothetical protein
MISDSRRAGPTRSPDEPDELSGSGAGAPSPEHWRQASLRAACRQQRASDAVTRNPGPGAQTQQSSAAEFTRQMSKTCIGAESLEISLPDEVCSISDVSLFVDTEQRILLVESKSGYRFRLGIPEQLDTNSTLKAKFSRKRHKLIVYFNKQLMCKMLTDESKQNMDAGEQSTGSSCSSTQVYQKLELAVESERSNADDCKANMGHVHHPSRDADVPATRTAGQQKDLSWLSFSGCTLICHSCRIEIQPYYNSGWVGESRAGLAHSITRVARAFCAQSGVDSGCRHS